MASYGIDDGRRSLEMAGRSPASPDGMFSPGRKMEPVGEGEHPQNFARGCPQSFSHNFDRRSGNVPEDGLNLLQNDEEVSSFPGMFTADFPDLGEVDLSSRAEFDHFGHFIVPPLCLLAEHFYSILNGRADFCGVDGLHSEEKNPLEANFLG